MMDLAPLQAAVAVLGPTDSVVVPRDAMAALLAEIGRGHAAERHLVERNLINGRTIAHLTPTSRGGLAG